MAQQSEVLGRRDDAGNQLAHAEERVLEDETGDELVAVGIESPLVLSHQLDADRAA